MVTQDHSNAELPVFVPEPIPQENRSPNLKTYLRGWAESLVAVKKLKPEALEGIGSGFSFLCFYWLVPVEQHNALHRNKHSLIESSGFEGERIKGELEAVLSEDQHLKECCDTAMNLAYVIDYAVRDVITLIDENLLTDDEYDKLFLRFSEVIYSQPFRKMTLTHLHNFYSPEKLLSFGRVQIMRLEPSDILDMIGEMSVYNILHNHQTGDFFAITESVGGAPDLLEWLFDERAISAGFVGILQYYKDGLVDIDYTTPYFLPEWVNRIRKRGPLFIGDTRRMPYANSTRFYSLTRDEAEEVNGWWQIYQSPQVEKRLENPKNNLRQVLLRAGNYYESSMQQKDAVDRLVHLAIALEALFSPSDKLELSYKMNLYASWLISGSTDERVDNFKFLKEMYEQRSFLFHGTFDVNKDLITTEEAERLAGIIRISILRFLVLYLKGAENRENIDRKLRDGVLNPSIIEQLRVDSDPKTFIEQFQPPAT